MSIRESSLDHPEADGLAVAQREAVAFVAHEAVLAGLLLVQVAQVDGAGVGERVGVRLPGEVTGHGLAALLVRLELAARHEGAVDEQEAVDGAAARGALQLDAKRVRAGVQRHLAQEDPVSADELAQEGVVHQGDVLARRWPTRRCRSASGRGRASRTCAPRSCRSPPSAPARCRSGSRASGTQAPGSGPIGRPRACPSPAG